MAEDYEQLRRQRLEENKKRMEELNLHKHASSLAKSPSKSSKYSPAKRMRIKPENPAPVRRSNRVADRPRTSYREEPLELFRERGRRVYSYQRRDLANRVYASYEARTNAEERAIALEAELDPEFPTCIKPMTQSHVTGGFWLSLPLPFCQENLSQHDQFLTLVDEEGSEWTTKYLIAKNGLSGGWRGFAIAHELVDGDCLIFQLIKPNTLKVYICRVNISGSEDNFADDHKEDVDDSKSRSRKRTTTANEEKDDAEDVKHGKKTRSNTKKTKGFHNNQAAAQVVNSNTRKSSRLNKGKLFAADAGGAMQACS